MGKTRKVRTGGRWEGANRMHCRLCGGLLCRGEGFRLKGYGTVCVPCRGLIARGRLRGGQDDASYATRDRERAKRANCERDGACRLREGQPPVT